MAKYITVWNVLTPKGMKKPGKVVELTEEQAAALPAGSVKLRDLDGAPDKKTADTKEPAA